MKNKDFILREKVISKLLSLKESIEAQTAYLLEGIDKDVPSFEVERVDLDPINDFVRDIIEPDDYEIIGLLHVLKEADDTLSDIYFSPYGHLESIDDVFGNVETYDQNLKESLREKEHLTASDIGIILEIGTGAKVNKHLESLGIIHKIDSGAGGWKLDENYLDYGVQFGGTESVKGWVRWKNKIINKIN